MKLGALLAAILCLAGAAVAFAGQVQIPSEDPLFEGTLTKAEAERILAAVVPTPFEHSFVAEVTPLGNVVLPLRPMIVAVAGQTPAGVLPERCRAEFARLPRDATMICMSDDSLYRRSKGE